MIRLRMYSRPGCGLCEEMREVVDRLLQARAREWEVVDVDSDAELSRLYGSSIPVLFVNGRLFAKLRLPPAAGLRLRRRVSKG